MKLDILVFGAHPDDVEIGCGGTILKEISLGKKVGIIDLTKGELGTRGSSKIRSEEVKKASKILGVSVRENLQFEDGFFMNDKTHQLEIVKIIRKYKPNIVLCNAVDDRHIDHPKGSKLVSDSCFLSGLSKIETKIEGRLQENWRPKNVFHYIQWKNIDPDFVVNISGFMKAKLKSVFAYSSQFYDPKSKAPKTPISSKNFAESIEYRAKDFGRLIGVEFAEGFTSERYIAIESLDMLI